MFKRNTGTPHVELVAFVQDLVGLGVELRERCEYSRQPRRVLRAHRFVPLLALAALRLEEGSGLGKLLADDLRFVVKTLRVTNVMSAKEEAMFVTIALPLSALGARR